MSKDYGNKIDLNPQTSVARINKVEAQDFNDIATDMSNLELPKKGVWFNSSDAGVVCEDNANTIFNNTDISICFNGVIDKLTIPSYTPPIVGHIRGVGSYNAGTFGVAYGNGAAIQIINEKDSSTIITGASFDYTKGERVDVVATFDSTTLESKIYKNGILMDTRTMTGAVINATTKKLRFMRYASTQILGGTLYDVKIYNKVLTADEVSNRYSGLKVPYNYIGANKTELTSGNLIVGKSYKIVSYLGSDVFTNVGASSNTTGVEFIATGITPTTWTSSSILVQIGCIADYDNDGIGEYSWIDSSSNDYHGKLENAKAFGYNIGDRRTAYVSTTASSIAMLDVIPAGWRVNSISMETAQSLTGINVKQVTSDIDLITGKSLSNGSFAWGVADHNIYDSAENLAFTYTGNGGDGVKIYVEMEKVK